MKKIKKSFASDNYSGTHPKILEALALANEGHQTAYGGDEYTDSAKRKFRELLGDEIEVYFVFTGTAANVLSIKSATNSYNAVICADTSHINVDECGAPENFTGCKLLTVKTDDGKITVDGIRQHMHRIGDEHHVQPGIISITQSTELGAVYTPEEISEITDYAHNNGLLVHMDGARISNAAASLGCSLRDITTDAGIDILSFGGTKNGLMFGEAVIFFDNTISPNFKFIRKQAMQLASKMRFISIQFDTILTDNLWLENARHANRMAIRLSEEASKIPGVDITVKVEANEIFAALPPEHIAKIQEEYFFYVWDEEASVVRWVTSFDTTVDDVDNFLAILKKTLT